MRTLRKLVATLAILTGVIAIGGATGASAAPYLGPCANRLQDATMTLTDFDVDPVTGFVSGGHYEPSGAAFALGRVSAFDVTGVQRIEYENEDTHEIIVVGRQDVYVAARSTFPKTKIVLYQVIKIGATVDAPLSNAEYGGAYVSPDYPSQEPLRSITACIALGAPAVT